MNNSKKHWDAMLITSIVLVAGLCAQAQQSIVANDAVEPEGRIVEIGPSTDTDLPISVDQTEEPAQPTYWIGVRGRNVSEPVLRTQFQLAEDLGVVIEDVVPDSPAAKAGLRRHDILLRANGEGVQSMEDLAELVSTSNAEPIELRLIRLGKEETIVVVPEERPAGMETPDRGRGFGFGGDADDFNRLFQGGLDEQLNGFRMFPGGFVFWPRGAMGAMDFNKHDLPNGYSVRIMRQNDQPPKVTVKKGDQTWTIVGEDQEALEELPEDVREHVQRLLENPAQRLLGGEMEDLHGWIYRI